MRYLMSDTPPPLILQTFQRLQATSAAITTSITSLQQALRDAAHRNRVIDHQNQGERGDAMSAGRPDRVILMHLLGRHPN
jgi:hypothetical protein